MNHPNPFANLGALQDTHYVWFIAPKTWRLVKEPVVGQINGLPTFRGLAVATNGIHVAILTSANNIVVGHLFWFLKDKPDEQTDLFEPAVAKPTNRNVSLRELDEFFV